MSCDPAVQDTLEIRVHGHDSDPGLIYLPGIHGDWTLLASFRNHISRSFRFVEITYPRTLEWTIEDYAAAVTGALKEQGIHRGWLLGESFSSQVAWAIAAAENQLHFQTQGIVLAGGFVRYPFRLRLEFARVASGLAPWQGWRLLFRVYGWYARFRHRRAAETAASVPEFIARRTPLDIQAIRHRMSLLRQFDARDFARRTQVPVYLLAGYFDPVVPPRPVRKWLRENCPGYREHRIIFPGDHNVLGTEPEEAAKQIVQWIRPKS